jgi:hypothetical protein
MVWLLRPECRIDFRHFRHANVLVDRLDRTVTFVQQSAIFVALRGNQASVREFALSVVTTKKGD